MQANNITHILNIYGRSEKAEYAAPCYAEKPWGRKEAPRGQNLLRHKRKSANESLKKQKSKPNNEKTPYIPMQVI